MSDATECQLNGVSEK